MLLAFHRRSVANTPAQPDVEIVQRLAFVTYRSKQPSELEALNEASEVLSGLAPQTSNDAETLRLWGNIHLRLWQLTNEGRHLDEAARTLKRGFYLRNDHENGIEYAFLLNGRAARSTRAADSISPTSSLPAAPARRF